MTKKLDAGSKEVAQLDELTAQTTNQRLSALVEGCHDAIICKTLDGTVVSWNPGAEQLYGYTAAEMIGTSIARIIPEERCHELHDVVATARSGAVCDLETQRRRKDGALVDVSVTASPVRDASGDAVGVSVIARDIGRRKRAEAALVQALRFRDEFLATLSHELRNPLMAMLTASELLERGVPDVQVGARAGAVVARQARHMARLLDDLLDVTRLERGGMSLRKERMDLRTVIPTVLDEVVSRIEVSGAILAVDLPNEPVLMDADPTRMRQMLVNLLTNAIKYTPRDEEIRVSIEVAGAEAVLRVRDRGVGIPPDAIESVFEPFVRNVGASHDDAQEDGLGLGLAIVRAIARVHGGAIAVKSEGLGHGAEFVVTLPRAEARAEAEHRDGAVAARVTPGSDSVLVVEDQEDNRELLVAAMKAQGFCVTTAGSVREAAAEFERTTPGVAIIDIGLPDGSGCDVARKIRAAAGAAPLLIALTGHGQQRDRDGIAAAGFDHYLLKPVSVVELCRVISDRRVAPIGKTEGGVRMRGAG